MGHVMRKLGRANFFTLEAALELIVAMKAAMRPVAPARWRLGG